MYSFWWSTISCYYSLKAWRPVDISERCFSVRCGHCLFRHAYCALNRLRCGANTFTCPGKPKPYSDMLYHDTSYRCDWSWTRALSQACLYLRALPAPAVERYRAVAEWFVSKWLFQDWVDQGFTSPFCLFVNMLTAELRRSDFNWRYSKFGRNKAKIYMVRFVLLFNAEDVPSRTI